MREIVLLLDNIRSAHNVGAILRTAEGLGVKRVYALGLTPYPRQAGDTRLPHVSARASRAIAKTALGSERQVVCQPAERPHQLIKELKASGYTLIGLEQTPDSRPLTGYTAGGSRRLALIVGHEVKGLSSGLLAKCDVVLAIPMAGKKESFNVSAAAAMAVYHLTFNA